jgi:Raf kinase inhibitor-like YbhB/YbcL family protein
MRKGLCLLASLLITAAPLAHADDVAAANAFAITSTATLDQGALPVLYTCDGKDVSPQLAWTNPPKNTQAYAIVMTDPDAPGGEFYHWIVYNLPKSEKQIDEGVAKLPAGTLTGKNSFDKEQYNGPCPPKGSAHTYVITLYALSSKVSLPAGQDGKAVLAALKPHVAGSVTFSATYSRWMK